MSIGRTDIRSRCVVIGSGPAAVACAHALVEAGLRPLVVDAGRDLAPEQRATLESLQGEPAAWDASAVAQLRSSFAVDFDELPLKPTFGSLHPYAVDEPLAPLRADGVGVVPSLGRGGLSSVWGGAMLPFEQRELESWPLAAGELEEHYRRVLRFVPLAGERDALEERFPLFADPQPLPATAQVSSLLADLRGAGLQEEGVLAGRSRLALWSDRCREVGLCMFGCPYGAIYNAGATLAGLVRDGACEYEPGVFVEALEERSGGVRLQLRSLSDGSASELTGGRVFVGAGALATTRLLLRSLEAFDRSVSLLDNSYFTLPVVRTRRGGRVGRGREGVTLAQAFLELDVDGSPVHLQVYGFSELMLRALAARVRLPEHVCERVFQPLLSRLLLVQGYLHAAAAPTIRVRLERDGTLVAEPGPGPDPAPAVAQVVRRLRRLRRFLRFAPVSPMLHVWTHGKGFHVGGSFPMRDRPGAFETDLLGRPPGLQRVHVVDSAVFPTLPPTTITLSIMANAHRIGTQAAAL